MGQTKCVTGWAIPELLRQSWLNERGNDMANWTMNDFRLRINFDAPPLRSRSWLCRFWNQNTLEWKDAIVFTSLLFFFAFLRSAWLMINGMGLKSAFGLHNAQHKLMHILRPKKSLHEPQLSPVSFIHSLPSHGIVVVILHWSEPNWNERKIHFRSR